MIMRLILAALLLVILSHCGNKTSQQPIQPLSTGELTKADILGTFDNLVVGDSLSLRPVCEVSGQVDSAKISYSWMVQRNDTMLMADTGREFPHWTPLEAGQYKLSLDVTYEGKTVSTNIILIILEKMVYVDSNRVARLKSYQDHLPGCYVGTVTTPWVPGYGVAMTLDSNGTYSAFNTESDQLPALYYGTDSDGTEKTWSLDDIKTNGTASGNLTILFDVGTTTQDDIRDLQFTAGFDTLKFSLWHLGCYGPVKLALARIESSAMPMRPLPTPVIHLSGTMANQNWKDSVIVQISCNENLSIVYQVLPMPVANPNLLNPMSLWRTDITPFQYNGLVAIKSNAADHMILARATDGTRLSGVAVQLLYFEKVSQN